MSTWSTRSAASMNGVEIVPRAGRTLSSDRGDVPPQRERAHDKSCVTPYRLGRPRGLPRPARPIYESATFIGPFRAHYRVTYLPTLDERDDVSQVEGRGLGKRPVQFGDARRNPSAERLTGRPGPAPIPTCGHRSGSSTLRPVVTPTLAGFWAGG